MATLPDGLDRRANEFLIASVADWTGKAARMLAGTPELADYSQATALLLGDVARVREEIERDPEVATRTDPQTGWTPLHVVCASKWPKLDASRTAGLLATARLLLERGATVGDDDLYLAAFGPGDHSCLRALLDSAPGVAAVAEKALSAPISTKDVEAVRLLLDAAADPRRFADDEGGSPARACAATGARRRPWRRPTRVSSPG